jgi:hypothetical protein
MRTMKLATVASLLACFLGLGLGCTNNLGADAGEEDLTSLTALQRELKFVGVVYVAPTDSDTSIVRTIQMQTQTAFGALRESHIGVNTRELAEVNPATFVKTRVKIRDANIANDPGEDALRVVYTYTDKAVVPATMATRSAIQLALLRPDYVSENQRVFEECTDKSAHSREFVNGSIWYVFNPSLPECTSAIATEQKIIDADRAKLGNALTTVAKSEASRLYIPVTMSLGRLATSSKVAFPEYDRLYGGAGVSPGKLVIGMVGGFMADWASGQVHQTYEDQGYPLWLLGMREIFSARPGFKFVSVEPVVDLLTYTLGTKKVTFANFDELIRFELDGQNPVGLAAKDRDAVRALVADTLVKHWLIFEVPIRVTMKGRTTTSTIKLQTYFGAGRDGAPHKRAIKTSDIFVYNGHSYIGYGPLDPGQFTKSDFPASYQILMINGCVSYNYYEKDYIPLKQGGTANLDLVTNGLESAIGESGEAMGRFVGAFIDGTQKSYIDVLKAAQFTSFSYSWGQDALRVVDGELDNKYDPAVTPITVLTMY